MEKNLEKKPLGKPFPFSVSGPLAGRTLDCCVAYNKFGAYCVPVSGLHRPAARFVLAGEVWEEPTLDLMIAECGAGDIVHAGTFFGDFLPALSVGIAEGAKIWAFEPHPESYRCALLTVLLNDLTNIELFNAGLGERQETGLLVTRDFDGISLGGASQILQVAEERRTVRGTDTVPTSLVRIDETVPPDRTISILQLDVEGFEQRALSGAMHIIGRDRPLLIIETMPKDEWLQENLWPLGYRIAETILKNTIVRVGGASTVSVSQ